MTNPACAVLCSGQGTNLTAILRAVNKRVLRARIALVVSDNPKATALLRAQAARIPTIVIDPRHFRSRESFDRALSCILDGAKVKWIILAGFMRILSPLFVRKYRGRILNIHPALLPAFPGAHGVRDALEHGVKVTGVTVHFVDENVDHGPIIAQVPLVIRPGERERQLMQRIHQIEHRLYPRVIQRVISGGVTLKGRKVMVR